MIFYVMTVHAQAHNDALLSVPWNAIAVEGIQKVIVAWDDVLARDDAARKDGNQG